MSQSPEKRIDFEEFKSITRAMTTCRELNFLVDHLVEHISETNWSKTDFRKTG